MKVVIIEDEKLSADRLASLLREIDPGIHVEAVLDSVRSASDWFKIHTGTELIFMDIQLGDGLSFEIFDKVKISQAVIFITAFQEYAIRAFKVNSVDYLLKPLVKQDLKKAIEKYRLIFEKGNSVPAMEAGVLENIREMLNRSFKSRFMVKIGEKIKSVEVKEILYFFSLEKASYMHTRDDRNYAIDYSLDTLGELLDPEIFFRINRQYILSHDAISEMFHLSGSRIKVRIKNSEDAKIFVSRERLNSFKEWLDR